MRPLFADNVLCCSQSTVVAPESTRRGIPALPLSWLAAAKTSNPNDMASGRNQEVLSSLDLTSLDAFWNRGATKAHARSAALRHAFVGPDGTHHTSLLLCVLCFVVKFLPVISRERAAAMYPMGQAIGCSEGIDEYDEVEGHRSIGVGESSQRFPSLTAQPIRTGKRTFARRRSPTALLPGRGQE